MARLPQGEPQAVRSALRRYVRMRAASFHPGRHFPEDSRVWLIDTERALNRLRRDDRETLIRQAVGYSVAAVSRRNHAAMDRIYRRAAKVMR